MKIKFLTKERSEFLKSDFAQGFTKFCRFQAADAAYGRFISILNVESDHRQQDGFIHAGVMATMADHTAGYSAFTIVPDDYQILTVEFKINFLRPASGNALRCESKVIRGGKQLIVAESDVYDAQESGPKHVAKALVSLMAVHKDSLVIKK